MSEVLDDKIKRFFPEVDFGIKVLGAKVLIQGMTIEEKTASGIIIGESVRKQESYDIQVGKLVAIGPLAYKNKETLEEWKEGAWAKVGDLVSVPRAGKRIQREIDGVAYSFVLLNDVDIEAVFPSLDGFPLFKF